MFKGLFKAAQRGRAVELRAVTGGAYGGGYAGNNRMLGYNAEGIDYNKEAGLRWDNSIVYAVLSFLTTALNGTPIITARREKGKARPVPIPEHPITRLLNKPNPWYDGSLLTSCAVFCEGARGNSYTYKHRNPRTNELVALEFLPDATCFPFTWPGSGEWISEYRIATATGYWRVPPCDVLQMRWMTANPFWPVLGMSPLESNLPDIVADILAAKHEAMIIKNAGVASVSIAPLKAPEGEPQPLFGKTQRTEIRRQVEQEIGGDARGGVMVWSEPLDIKQLGFDPKALMLTEVRKLSESRICAGFSIPPVVVGMLVGLEKSNNRASIEGAIDLAIDMGILPLMRHRGNQFSEDLVPELGEPGDVVMYDESAIPEVRQRLVRRLTEWAGRPIYSLNEARAEAGLEGVKGGKVIAGKPEVGEAVDSDEDENTPVQDSSTETVDDADGTVRGRRGDKVEVSDGGDNGDGG
jgi:phage portal protein BeeE